MRERVMRIEKLLLCGLTVGLLTAAMVSCGSNPAATALDDKLVEAQADGPPYDSGRIPLIGAGRTLTFTIPGALPSETDVSLGFIAVADLGTVYEYFTIRLNGIDLGTIFELNGGDCTNPALETEVVVPAETFNTALQAEGRIQIEMIAASQVDLNQCAGGYIRVIVDYCGSGPCPKANPVPGPPRVVSAVSTGNTSVRVTFNEPVFEGAKDPSNFSIIQANVNSESAALRVDRAALSQDMTVVTLTTASQNEVTYELIVTGIQDLAGNVIAPPDILVNPTRTQFAGTPPVDGGPDSDGDGLSDALEQNGWAVNVTRVNGDIDSYTVTSDPTRADTDADGVSDADEFRNRSDPRRQDTDGDTVSDSDEWNIIFSDLTKMDTDDDGIDDNLEVALYKTSPTLADTDGDGLTDSREVLELFRDPRIADLPRPRITVGRVRMSLDERYTFTNEEGETTSVESSSSTALAESTSKQYSSSDGDTTASAREAFVKGNVEAEISKDPSLTIGAEGGFKWNWSDSHTTQFSQESSQQSQRTYENSLSKGRQFTRSSQVTRTIEGANMSIDVTVENAGDIAFSISNLQVSALQRSLFSLSVYEPIAALTPASESGGDGLVLNLGPLVPERGPIIFSNREIFPALVENLMSSPRGLTFKIANFDMTDEFGRNFAFSSQEARDRSAGIVIDRGDGAPERVLVALNGQYDTEGFAGGGFVGGFDARGRTVGIPMDYILQDILGYEKNRRAFDAIVAGKNFRADTAAAGDDVQLIPRGTSGLLPHDIVIAAGPNGRIDSALQGDDFYEITTGYETSPTCGVTTPERIIEPLLGGDGVASSIARDDDVQVVPVGAAVSAGATIISPGPDGVIDSFPEGDDKAIFPGQTGKADGIAEPASGGDGRANTHAVGDDVQRIAVGAPAAPNAVIIEPGPNGFIDSIPEGDDLLVSRDCGGYPINGKEVLVRFENRRSGDFQRVWMVLVDRNIPASANFGELLVRPGDDIALAFIQDQDRDGLFAQEEFAERSSDIDDDSDDDALDDFAEVRVGWDVGVVGGVITEIRPDPSRVDSDGDDIPDWYEQDLRRLFNDAGGPLTAPNPRNLQYIPTAAYQQIFGTAWTSPGDPRFVLSSNPRLTDSDGDGLSDKEELYGYVVGVSIRAGSNDVCNTEALGDDVQKVMVQMEAYEPPGQSNGGVVILPGPNLVIDSLAASDDVYDGGTTVRTNPLNPDHDGDTRPDGQERDLGGNPTNPNDPDDFRDTDRDGLSDAEEEILGWSLFVNNPGCTPMFRNVTSNKFVSDTDLDGLPDLVERLIGSDPTREDTDCDGLADFDEFAEFDRYVDFALQFPGFELDGTGSARYGTSLVHVDTDGDGLTDSFELLDGWRVFAAGFEEPRQVYPDPRFIDTDLDGWSDFQERTAATDPRDADTDGDGRIDSNDSEPLGPSIRVTVSVRNWQYLDIGDCTNGEDGSRWQWAFSSNINGSQVRTLFTQNDVDCPRACPNNSCFVGEGLFRGYSTTRSETYTMRPGDVLFVEGFVLFMRQNCEFGCDLMELREAYSYSNLAGGDEAAINTVELLGNLGELRGRAIIRLLVE